MTNAEITKRREKMIREYKRLGIPNITEGDALTEIVNTGYLQAEERLLDMYLELEATKSVEESSPTLADTPSSTPWPEVGV